jgi:hypothetical protein
MQPAFTEGEKRCFELASFCKVDPRKQIVWAMNSGYNIQATEKPKQEAPKIDSAMMCCITSM